MAKLTDEERKELPDSDFALPEQRKYPIEDENHARDALARVSADGTVDEQRAVRKAVDERYPQIGSD